jgi:hypothetical protein
MQMRAVKGDDTCHNLCAAREHTQVRSGKASFVATFQKLERYEIAS